LALAASTYTSVWQAYRWGALNYTYQWGVLSNTRWVYEAAHQRIEVGPQFQPARWAPFLLGGGLTAFVMFMRGRFYWWPLHPVGLLWISGHHIDRLWLSFFLGWLVKISLMKFGSGRSLRQARYFFIGLILVESFTSAVSSLVRVVTLGTVPNF
ncbi:MAG: DUF6784 domain-containing protein, partial [Planctomycetota bacterium]